MGKNSADKFNPKDRAADYRESQRKQQVLNEAIRHRPHAYMAAARNLKLDINRGK